MRKYVPLLIAGSALIAAACRDSVAPPEANEAAALYKHDRSFSALVGDANVAGATTVTFTLSPNGGQGVKVGEFTLDYSANAVCVPATSGYGPGYWRLSCETLQEPITITATSWVADGRSYTEFSPDIRFSPAATVQLSVVREAIIGDYLSLRTALANNIWYVRLVGTYGFFVDEGWLDPEIRTHFDTETGLVWRRIRHFSGWSVRSGDCEAAPMPTDVEQTTVSVSACSTQSVDDGR